MKFDVGRVRSYLTPKVLLGFLVIGLLLFVYLYRIGSLNPNYSKLEVESISSASQKSEIIKNPLYLPHKLAELAIFKYGFRSVAAFRAVSAIFTVAVIILFYRLLKRWHSSRIAALTTAMFASSTLTLAVARHASPTSLLLVWFVVIAALVWLRHNIKNRWKVYIIGAIMAASLYVPGAPYIIILCTILYHKQIIRYIRHLGWKHLAGVVVGGIIVLTPLVYAIWTHHIIFREWLLIPVGINLHGFVSNLISIPRALIYRTPASAEFWLPPLPLLDIFSGTMLLLGIYAYRYHLGLRRTVITWATILGCLIVIGMAGLHLMILIMPFLYILIANGISFMLSEWYKVFPKNPIARPIGFILIAIAVAGAIFYQSSRYFIAWPKSQYTREVYSIKQ